MDRRKDRVSEVEFSEPWVIGGNALQALQLLRPQLFFGHPTTSLTASTVTQHGQLYVRETPEADAGGMLVSVNEGRPQSVDVLTILPARMVREMRYLRAVDATARFGINANGGPVLIVYMK